MKKYIKQNLVLLILLAIAVVVSLFVVAARWRAESENTTYDIVIDYSELELMVEQSDHDMSWWLDQFYDMGITQVGLSEESLISLMEDSPLDVTVTMMDAVIEENSWEENYPADFVAAITEYGYDRYDVLVETVGQEATDFVVDAIRQRFHEEDSVIFEQGENAFILLNGTISDTLYQTNPSYVTIKGVSFATRKQIAASKLMYISIGLMPEKVETILASGMEIIPRTMGYDGHNDALYAQAVIDGYESYGITPTYIIAGGDAVIGHDDTDELILNYLTENDITIGLIETSSQRGNLTQSGLEDTVQSSGYNAVRVFSMWDYIQYRYAYYGYEGAEEIENTLYRAVTERNIRILYFKAIKQTNNSYVYITDVDVYRDLFESLDARLAVHGITRGQASVLPEIEVSSVAMLIMGLGSGIGGVLLLGTFLHVRRKHTVLLTAAAAVCVTAAWLVLPNTFRLIASFASAAVFACLAAAFFLKSAKEYGERTPSDTPLTRIWPRAVLILAVAVLISFAGAMMTAAPLSSTYFMLEIGIFRGVKLAQILPLVFFCLLFVSYYGLFEKGRRENTLKQRDILRALRWQIPVWGWILLAGLAYAGYYYIARTGHETDVTVSTAELIFRNYLESFLLARPRTKEFLLAFPAIMLAVHCAVRKLPFWTALFGLVGTIGLTSVCNTFMHIRTPLYLGFFRTACSLILGIVIGAVYTAVFELLYKLYGWGKKKLTDTE